MNDSQHRPSDMRKFRANHDAIFRKPASKFCECGPMTDDQATRFEYNAYPVKCPTCGKPYRRVK